jgi:hypothetical protein
MTRKAYIAVDMRGDQPVFELIIDGVKQCELSAIETLELGLNASSAVRWAIPTRKK